MYLDTVTTVLQYGVSTCPLTCSWAVWGYDDGECVGEGRDRGRGGPSLGGRRLGRLESPVTVDPSPLGTTKYRRRRGVTGRTRVT